MAISVTSKERSEPIQDIIERMPNKFATVITLIISTLVILLILFSWLIKYPDTVTGQIIINAKFSPVKLVANSSGRITIFNFKPKDDVREGEYIAVIQNPANIKDMKVIKELVNETNLYKQGFESDYNLYPTKVSLGEVNLKYYTFLNDLQQIYEYKKSNIYLKQEENLRDDISKLGAILSNNKILRETHFKNMNLTKKFSYRDSILLAEKIATEEELDQSKINYFTSKENYQNVVGGIITTEQQIADDQNKLAQQIIQRHDKERQMQLDLLSAFNDLKDNIKSWELTYVFKSPINGKIDFLNFFTNDEFIQAGQDVFTIIPKQNKVIGQVQLPSTGSGKVKVGQDVIIKLDNYPYEEYGTVKGKVASISLISNKVKEKDQTETDNYLVEVDLPHELTTNYGKKLEFKYEIKGNADIIVTDRRLIERFFDNLKYNSSK